MRLASHLAALALLTISMGACATEGKTSDGLLVVATTSILGDIASNVVGDEGTVEVLIPTGVDSHDFQASARQAVRVAEADLVVANGLGLEQGVGDLLASVAADGNPVIELAPLADPLPFPHGGQDPHFWMDPIRVGDAAFALADELAELHPTASWSARANEYAATMADTDATITDNLGVIPEAARKMVTNHESFGYFADRYGFEIVGVVIPGGSTQADPSSAQIAALVEVMRQQGSRAIFAETTQPTTLAEAVAAELRGKVEVVELFTESLGPDGSGAETLGGMLLTNSARIAAALSGDA